MSITLSAVVAPRHASHQLKLTPTVQASTDSVVVAAESVVVAADSVVVAAESVVVAAESVVVAAESLWLLQSPLWLLQSPLWLLQVEIRFTKIAFEEEQICRETYLKAYESGAISTAISSLSLPALHPQTGLPYVQPIISTLIHLHAPTASTI